MQNLVHMPEGRCRPDIPCEVNQDIIRKYTEENRANITSIDGLSGIKDHNLNRGSGHTPSMYGASFKEVNYNTPYFETMVMGLNKIPWYGERTDRGFMNQIKTYNEPEVKTYSQVEFEPIPDQEYESVPPSIEEQERMLDQIDAEGEEQVEGFDGVYAPKMTGMTNIIGKLCLVFVALVLIYMLLKK